MLDGLKLAREIVNLRKVIVQDEEGVFNLLNQSKDNQVFDWRMIQTELQKLSNFDVELSKNLGNIEKEQFVNTQEKFKEFIRYLNLNQEDFAKMLCVSRQTISSIETGKYNPSLELAFAISDFFDKRIDEIFIYERGVENEKK